MSAIKAKIEAEVEAAKQHLTAALAHLKEIEHEAVARVEQALHALEGDVPQLERDAEADAADVAKTAATEGVIPAEHKAVEDAGELGVEVVGDVKAAVEDAAHSPQQTTAVIAGETAVADSGQHQG